MLFGIYQSTNLIKVNNFNIKVVFFLLSSLRQLLESGTQAKWLSEYLRRANMAMKHNSEVSAVGKKKIRMGAVSFQALMLQDLKVLFHLFVLVNLGTAFVVIAEILSMKFA